MTQWTQEAMEKRLVRYADLKGLRNAFIDARTPGSDRKENFTIIGPGVSENPAQVVHIPEAHGLKLLKGGKLIDTTLGEKVPPGAEMEQPPDAAKLKELATPPMSELSKYAVKAADIKGDPNSPLAGPGAEEAPVIGDVDAK